MKYLLKLEDTLKALQSGGVTCEDASKLMNSEISRDEIKHLLKVKDESLDKTEIEKLGCILKVANYIYTYSGLSTGITDSDYDKLISIYQSVSGDMSFTIDSSNDNKEYHRYPVLRGTLNKIYSLGESDLHQKVNDHRETLDQWIAKMENKIYLNSGEMVHLRDETVLCFPKWDGVSCVFEFDEKGKMIRALTRGHTDVNTAKNISCHFPNMKSDVFGRHGVKTEIMVFDETVDAYSAYTKRLYSQSRSVASAIINSNTPSEFDSMLVIKKLRYLKEGRKIEDLCTEVFDDPYIRCKLKNTEEILRFSEDCRNVNGCRCDGVVIRFTNPEIIKKLGREDNKNNFEVAYKFTEESAYATVKDIEFRMGLFGRLTPVVTFEPIKLKGNKVKSASLGSMSRFRSLHLSKGDTIKIFYDIIPYVTIDPSCKITDSDPIKEPRYCPDCGSLLEKNGDIISCANEKCSWVMKGRILNYIEKMKIDNISGMTVVKLFDAGFLTCIEDLYTLKKHKSKICKMDGFGEESVERFLRGIERSRDSIMGSQLLGAIGIEGNSRKTFKKLLELYTIRELLDFADDKRYDYLERVEGIGEKKAKGIIKGLRHNKKLIKFLLEVIDVVEDDEIPKSKFYVCFTKVRNRELEEFILQNKGSVVDNVTKGTSFLVVPTKDVTSRSTELAKKYGIPRVVIDDVESYITKNYL